MWAASWRGDDRWDLAYPCSDALGAEVRTEFVNGPAFNGGSKERLLRMSKRGRCGHRVLLSCAHVRIMHD